MLKIGCNLLQVATYFRIFALKYIAFMKYIKNFLGWLRRCISPVYVMMLVAAFILWYITKLGYTYTTDHNISVVVDGKSFDVTCTIRGNGTDLIGYTLSSKYNNFEIPVAELTFDSVVCDDDGRTLHHVSPISLQQALAARMSNVEVLSVGSFPPIEVDGQL